MPDLFIEVYPVREALPDDEGTEPLKFEADYLSFVNGDTYGKPPIVAPNDPDHISGSKTVLYVNPANVACVAVEKRA